MDDGVVRKIVQIVFENFPRAFIVSLGHIRQGKIHIGRKCLHLIFPVFFKPVYGFIPFFNDTVQQPQIGVGDSVFRIQLKQLCVGFDGFFICFLRLSVKIPLDFVTLPVRYPVRKFQCLLDVFFFFRFVSQVSIDDGQGSVRCGKLRIDG